MGLVRSLGLRDLDIQHLEALLAHQRPLPELLQLDLAPWEAAAQAPLLDWCASHQVALQATGLLHRGVQPLAPLASKRNVTAQQVMLRWAQQRGFQVLVNSSRREHVLEALELDFELDEEEMSFVNGLEGEVRLKEVPLHLGDLSRRRTEL